MFNTTLSGGTWHRPTQKGAQRASPAGHADSSGTPPGSKSIVTNDPGYSLRSTPGYHLASPNGDRVWDPRNLGPANNIV